MKILITIIDADTDNSLLDKQYLVKKLEGVETHATYIAPEIDMQDLVDTALTYKKPVTEF